MRTVQRLVSMGLPLSLLALSLLAQENNGKPENTPEVKHDVSPPLHEMHIPPRSDTSRERPLRTVPHGAGSNQPDPVVQTSAGPLVQTTGSSPSFPGVGNGDYGFVPNAAPPDTEGVVGATQYVQWVNESFAVFDKATGGKVFGPAAGNTIWSGFGGGCQTNNDGDPIVQYDKLANRWIFTQFSVSTTPYLQCVAVSQTSDATGKYNRYSFSYSNQFPDYPKLGVWPDAYYISFNIFNNGVSFAGSKVCAYDRASMLAGTAATQQCFQLSTSFGGLLPSDLDGPAKPPPAGEPNFFLNFGSNKLNLWKFHVDWTTPANTTLTGPTSIPVAAFTAACSGGGTCIPQSGTTQQLDSLADRLMYRLAYRNFGDHEALVVNHSVATGSGNVGVRWYELWNPATSPVVHQQGTFAPDSSYRWMGSIAMDHSGNIALGYSVSSSAMFPGIRFTGRAASDPLGAMQAENTIISGGGSQTGNKLSRWGDYSAMTVDPVDDCTFWYTNEYLKASGSFNWSTWISSFKLAGCGPPSADFSLSASPPSATVTVGQQTTSSIGVTGLNGFSGSVTLSVLSGCPANTTCLLSSTLVPAGSSSTLTVTTTASTPTGTFPIVVNGLDGALNHNTTFTLTVNPAAGNLSVSVAPTSITVSRRSSNTATVTVSGNSSSASLSVSGVPSKITAAFSPTSVAAGGGNSTLTVSANPAASLGSFTLMITATSGGVTSAPQPLTVTVN